MRKVRFDRGLVVFGLLVLVGCGAMREVANIPGPTPSLRNYGMGPLGEVKMPSSLSCPYFEHLAQGLEWHNLQIGISTYSEAIIELEPEKEWWNTSHAHLHLEEGGDIASRTYGSIQVCLVGEKLSAVSVSSEYAGTLPIEVNDLFTQFGNPDWITWGSNFWERSIFYLDEGFIALVDIELFEVDGYILFSPMSIEDLVESGILDALERPGPEFEPHYLQTPPKNWDLENPWLNLKPKYQ